MAGEEDKVKFPFGMGIAEVIKGEDWFLMADENGEALASQWNKAKEFLNITGIEMEPLVGGTTSGTALVVPNGPAGEQRTAEVSSGKWYDFGSGPVEASADRRWKSYWNGTVWSLKDMGALPVVDTDDLVAKNELQVDSTSVNKFNYQAIEDGYVDPSTGADMPASDYKRSSLISLSGNTTGKLAISGLGASHHGLGWKVLDASGAIILKGATAIDVANFIVDYSSVLATARTFKFTVKTNKSTDNTNIQAVQVEFGDTISPYQPFSNVLTGIGDDKFRAADVEGKAETVGKNKFSPIAITNGYIVVETGAYNNDAALKRTLKIDVSGNTSKIVTISGLGNIHWGLGWRVNDAAGNLLMFGQSAQDVTSFVIDYTSATNPATIEFTVKTNKTGDNTNLNNVQVEFGSIATVYEPYKRYISKLLGSNLFSEKSRKADFPTDSDDIVPLGFLQNEILNGSKIRGKRVLVLGDSITQDVNSWVRQAIPLMGGILLNLAVSGARAGDHPTTAINLSASPGTNSPDNVLSNQVRRAAQATTSSGQPITWTHPVTSEVFSVPTSAGVGTASFGVPDLIIIAISTNDTIYDQSFASVKDVALSTLPNLQLVGGLRWAIENLMILYPNAQILISTPIQSRAIGTNVDRPFDVTKVKRDRVVEVANYYSLSVIDAFYESGINEKFEIQGNGRYLSDGLHPNDNGKAKMRDFLINEINRKFVVRR